MTRPAPSFVAVLCLALILTPMAALAHKVIASVFPSGSAIEGEVGFSNGDMATDLEITVTGPDGAELGRTRTDSDGFFIFQPAEPVAHTFRADLGAGHVAEVTMPAAEVAHVLGQPVLAGQDDNMPDQTDPDDTSGGATIAALTDAERAAIAEAVRNEIRPLRREIAAYREKNDLQTILGGIGYIVGLFGLGFYIAARRRLGA